MTDPAATPTIDRLMAGWVAEVDTPDACAAQLLCDRWPADDVAFRFVAEDMTAVDLTFGELAERSRRLASGLAARGVRRGDRVPVMMSKREELVVTALALWRLGAVHVPLFTAFAAGAAQTRIEGAAARLVVAEPDQAAKLEGIAGIAIVRTGPEWDELAAAEPLAEDTAVGGDGPIALLFTSGTTGHPKGVPVPLRAAAAFAAYLTFSVDLRPEDVFWNAADHGWAYGLYYGIVGTLMLGATSLQYRGRFSPAAMAEVVRAQGVTNLAGAPTMFRALAKAGQVTEEAPLRLRRVCSAGEPLPPSMLEWGRQALGAEIRDHYGQTELGMVICTHAHPELAQPARPGSMGVPMPGIDAVLREGQIAIDATSPLFWFPGYLDDPDTTASRFTADGRWYLTGDTGTQDADGWFFFTSRDDDVILAAGYRIGPFDVESVLIRHPRVKDVAVVGMPDPEGVRGQEVVAFVVLTGPVPDEAALAAELQATVRDEYSKHAYPRRVHVVPSLPRTPSGKLQRHRLRQGEAG